MYYVKILFINHMHLKNDEILAPLLMMYFIVPPLYPLYLPFKNILVLYSFKTTSYVYEKHYNLNHWDCTKLVVER